MSWRTSLVLLAALAVIAAAVGLNASSSTAAPAQFRTVAVKTGAGVGFYSTGHVSCPTGYRVTGGGYRASFRVKVVASWPENGTTWSVTGKSTVSSPRTYYIFARCAT